jgi:hypothetical protein
VDSRDDLSRAHMPSVRNHPPYSLSLVRTAVVKPRVHRPQFYLSHRRDSSDESEGPVFAFKIAFQYFLRSHGHPCRKGQVHGVYAPMGFTQESRAPCKNSLQALLRSFIDTGSSDTCDVQPIHAFSLLPTVATASPIARSCIGLDSFRSSRNHLTSSLVWLVVAFLGGFEFDANHDSGSNPSAIRHASHVLAYPYTATRPFSIRMPANNQTFKRIPPRPRVDRARHAR